MSDLLWDESPTLKRFDSPLTGGVVPVLCACCAKTWIIINRTAYDGELQFCQHCLALPEAEAEKLITQTEETLLWQPTHHTQFLPL